MLREVDTQGSCQLGRLLARLIVQLLYGCGDNGRTAELDRLKRECEEDDPVAFALCRMLEIDLNLSPPWTHINLLNLAVVEGESSTATNVHWDSAEAFFKFDAPISTIESYEETYDLFRVAGAVGGMGAIRVRQGCL